MSVRGFHEFKLWRYKTQTKSHQLLSLADGICLHSEKRPFAASFAVPRRIISPVKNKMHNMNTDH